MGGGIFLAPVVLAMRWTETRTAAAILAVFNLLNSGAALLGAWATMPTLPAQLPVWLACVAIGGLVGSWPGALRLVLAALLLVAAVRMIATSF